MLVLIRRLEASNHAWLWHLDWQVVNVLALLAYVGIVIPVIEEFLLGLVISLVVSLARLLEGGVHIGVSASVITHYILVLIEVTTTLRTLLRVTLFGSTD